MFHRNPWGPQAYQFAGRFGGPGNGPFGRPPFGGGRGGPFKFGRMLRDGDLKLVALALIAEAPRHGYDIIKALEERSGGFYSPSPGVVYPTLTYLEEVGYASSEMDGNKKVFTIAEAGSAYLAENRATVDAVLEEMTRFGQKMSRLRESFDWHEGGNGPRPGHEEMTESMAELDKARRRLRGLIVAATEGTDADQKRVAAIINAAADQILGLPRES